MDVELLSKQVTSQLPERVAQRYKQLSLQLHVLYHFRYCALTKSRGITSGRHSIVFFDDMLCEQSSLICNSIVQQSYAKA
jgi:hypothetical protein